MASYTVYKLGLQEELSHKEHLNNITEVEEWLGRNYGKHARVLIVRDHDGVQRVATDNGHHWEIGPRIK